MTEPLTHRTLAKLRRNHWQPLNVGGATLQWSFQEGRYQMISFREREYYPADTDLDQLNARWTDFVSRNP